MFGFVQLPYVCAPPSVGVNYFLSIPYLYSIRDKNPALQP